MRLRWPSRPLVVQSIFFELVMKKIRVVVVDDSALVRSLLSEIINTQADMVCVGAANDPLVAREMIRELDPDVITLDIEMPKMDGLDFLGRLMRLRPMPVLMISTLTERGAEVTMKALELGAVDFVAHVGDVLRLPVPLVLPGAALLCHDGASFPGSAPTLG